MDVYRNLLSLAKERRDRKIPPELPWTPAFERESSGQLSPDCGFPSSTCAFLDGDLSFACCSGDLLKGSRPACRRSPRLLTNGYYVLTGDSFLSDEDGNVTLSPSRTTVIYKENSVRIFRRKKKLRRSLASLLDLSDDDAWLHGGVCIDADSPVGEAGWVRRDDGQDLCLFHARGDTDSSAEPRPWVPDEAAEALAESSASSNAVLGLPRGKSSASFLPSPPVVPRDLQGRTLGPSDSNSLRNVFYQVIMLTTCFIISLCARCWLGGLFASLLIFPLMLTLICCSKFEKSFPSSLVGRRVNISGGWCNRRRGEVGGSPWKFEMREEEEPETGREVGQGRGEGWRWESPRPKSQPEDPPVPQRAQSRWSNGQTKARIE
ncbi:transmembrane protein 71 [Ornithorhynchus anatinus]|uniref:Transmembrane protein 71 n=1 Tax=Ornithorhynchus anatinus TaxID=9258 RepID=K7E9B7_ORNAN|nr:transmembrane protein 71 [Ornithorhynchus anatinus]